MGFTSSWSLKVSSPIQYWAHMQRAQREVNEFADTFDGVREGMSFRIRETSILLRI